MHFNIYAINIPRMKMKMKMKMKLEFKLRRLMLVFALVIPSIICNPHTGMSPKDEEYFSTTSELLKCKDGSKKINRSQVNDDFCDCPDGSDEPGTSACPNGSFYCRNVGHMPLVLFSSRVNDGICDCCDGSDEYDSIVKCPNACQELGKAAKDKLKKKVATYQEGVVLRKKEVEQAKKAFATDETELTKLKNEEKVLKDLVEQLKEHKEKIGEAEEKERLEKEKEEKLKLEAEKESDQVKKEVNEEAESGKKEPGDSTNADIMSQSSNFMEQRKTAETENTEDLSKEELGRLVASRWTGEKTNLDSGDADAKDTNGAEVAPNNVHEVNDAGYASEFDDDDSKYDEPVEDHIDDDLTEEDHSHSGSFKSDSDDESLGSDFTTSSNPTWLKKMQNIVKNILQAVNIFQTPLNVSDAARVRKEYDEASTKLSTLQSRISSLTEKLQFDYGPEKEFYTFYDRCFESKQNKYVYKVCPFKKATQDEGHRATRLGHWEKFDDSYKAMIFSNGDHCWNGPNRSMRVKLRCGLKNELNDVDEPSRCEYVALLSTPSLCHEEKLKELQKKLDALDKEEAVNHDEL